MEEGAEVATASNDVPRTAALEDRGSDRVGGELRVPALAASTHVLEELWVEVEHWEVVGGGEGGPAGGGGRLGVRRLPPLRGGEVEGGGVGASGGWQAEAVVWRGRGRRLAAAMAAARGP